jgi:hypothetical protein
MRISLAALALASVLGCGGPLFSGDLTVPVVRITLPAQSFPGSTGTPATTCAGTTGSCVAVDLDYDLGAQLPLVNEPNVTYDVGLTSITLTLVTAAPGTDLGGVRSVAVKVRDASTGAAGPTIASYERTAAAAHPTSITIAGDASIDLSGYVRSGHLLLRGEVSYDAPTPPFTAQVEATFDLHVNMDFGAYL